jgi:hypothetical protein
MNIKKVPIPFKSKLSNQKSDYSDSFLATFLNDKGRLTPSQLVGLVFGNTPTWIQWLFSLRNRLVALFGLKTGKDDKTVIDTLKDKTFKVGDTIGLFEVMDLNDQEIIMGADDWHLNFRVSMLSENKQEIGFCDLYVSTSVVYNNFFGRVYFFFVKPFHSIIVPAMMRRSLKTMK